MVSYDREQYNELLKNIKKPKIVLSQKDVYYPKKGDLIQNGKLIKSEGEIDKEKSEEINHILDNYQCIICKYIPIEAVECNNCEVIFCQECIHEYKAHDQRDRRHRSNLCPLCKKKLETSELNDFVKEMTINKLLFVHRCVEKIDQDQELTAFEKFKKTPEYKKILINQGKLP